MKNIIKEIKAGNWNLYRQHYNDLTYLEKVKLHDDWYEFVNTGPSYNLPAIISFFELMGEDLTVVELGCADGSLANEILNRFKIINSWDGYDLSYPRIVYNPKCKNDKYTADCLLRIPFQYDCMEIFNVFIASHTLEHLNYREVKEVIERVSITAEWIILELPIQEGGQSWNNYNGAHVLEKGRKDIRNLLSAYEVIKETKEDIWTVLFKRRKG